MKQQDILNTFASSSTPEEGQKKVLEMIEEKLRNDNDFLAKTIAAYIRMNIEDFHHSNLTDEQMKELNPLIRNAVYTFLEDWSEGALAKILSTRILNCPDYWEDCEYVL